MREQLISENVSKVVAAVVVAIGLVMASSSLSTAIRDAGALSSNSTDPGDAPFVLMVQDGMMYMTHVHTGDVFKREDREGAEWEQVPSLPSW